MYLQFKTYEFILVKFRPVKNMYIYKKRISGRASDGKIILNYRGGGYKRFYKMIDFFRYYRYLPARVLSIEYDLNRNVYISLILYINGCLSYIICPNLLYIGDFIFSFTNDYLCLGGIFSFFRIPLGTLVHNVELKYKSKFIFSRSSGCSLQILKKVGFFILVRLMSKEERFISLRNSATLGRITYELKKFVKLKKASDSLFFGFKPVVRGVAKNPVDHPHGGGEARTTAGQPSVSPWGIYTKGVRTTTRFLRKNIKFKWGFFKRRTGILW